jgi:hypothetical protein
VGSDVALVSANPLVAAPVDMSTPLTGTFLLEDIEGIVTSVQSQDWLSTGLNGVAAVGDTLYLVNDPIGAITGMGFGWLLEHVEPLRGWLNDLTGDAGEVAGYATTWSNISASVAASGQQVLTALEALDGQEGAAADAYRHRQRYTAQLLTSCGKLGDVLSIGLQLASEAIKIVHDLLRDTIAGLLGSVVSAIVEAVATVGFALPLILEQLAARVVELSVHWTSVIARLIRKVGTLVDLVKRGTKAVEEVARELARITKRAARGAPKPGQGGRHRAPAAPAPSRISRFDTAGRDVSALLAKSNLTPEELTRYLESLNPPLGADFVKTGHWPEGVQIPRDSAYLKPDGSVDWPGDDGFGSGPQGVIRTPTTISAGQQFDRFGQPQGVFASPVGAAPEPYGARSLPWVEDADQYHRYEALQDLTPANIDAAVQRMPPGPDRREIEIAIKRYGVTTETGPIAPAFTEPGGGTQYKLPMTPEYLIELGLIKEVP